jgi:hypothetical protein
VSPDPVYREKYRTPYSHRTGVHRGKKTRIDPYELVARSLCVIAS